MPNQLSSAIYFLPHRRIAYALKANRMMIVLLPVAGVSLVIFRGYQMCPRWGGHHHYKSWTDGFIFHKPGWLIVNIFTPLFYRYHLEKSYYISLLSVARASPLPLLFLFPFLFFHYFLFSLKLWRWNPGGAIKILSPCCQREWIGRLSLESKSSSRLFLVKPLQYAIARSDPIWISLLWGIYVGWES